MSKEKALKRINEYLAKQEPKKVELGNMTAIKGALQILKGFDGKATKVVDKFDVKFKEYFNEYDNVLKVRNDIYNFVEREAKGILRTFEKNVKELGVDPNSLSEYKELQKWINEGEEIYKAIDRDYKRPKQ
mgnify:CR=1 FL=1|tara:strand:+ start:104 stop:496 length:393 start_codon:yes stop_codon:yes gene_type:complete